MSGHGRHGIFGVKPGSQHWGLCIHRESEIHVNVGPVSNLGYQGTTEGDKHPDSDHPQCQHRKVNTLVS